MIIQGDCLEVRNMIEWVYGCLSEDTEILTENGYKLFKDISKNEKICVYDKDNNSFSYEIPKNWSSYQVENEECYSIKSDKTDQIVSKNHRCLVEKNGELEFVFAEQLEKQKLFPLPVNILSLFDGMSVAQQALTELGVPVKTYYASEIDNYAIATTQSNFPNTIQLGSVVGLKLNEQIDLLIGGSPCQDLSIAKKNREGLKGERSGLFWEYVRIRDEVKPKYFILENVASMPKEAKDTISEALDVQPVMINASLVSAQNRKRLFWVGKWNGEKYEQVEIQQPKDRGILLKDILEDYVDKKYYVKINDKYGLKGLCESNEKSKSMTATMHKGYGNDGVTTVRVGSLNSGGQADRIYSQDGKSTALSANGGGRGAKTGLYCISSTQKHATITTDKSSPMVSAMGMGGGHVPMIANEMQIRKLTPTECLRLQSMPDDYFDKAEYKGKPISNTQRYKMCGNAFNCEVIKHIINNLNLATTLTTTEKIKYSGIIFCPTVSTGAFVARRNRQVFITGNSGFPKSLNIGK